MKIKLVGCKSVYIPTLKIAVEREQVFEVNKEIGVKLLAQGGKFEEVTIKKEEG